MFHNFEGSAVDVRRFCNMGSVTFWLLSVLVIGGGYGLDNTDTPTVSQGVTVDPVCANKLARCENQVVTDCIGIYEPWARDNCARWCGYCTRPDDVHTCTDEIPNCAEYPYDLCTNTYYRLFVEGHCKKFCNKCDTRPRYIQALEQADQTTDSQSSTTAQTPPPSTKAPPPTPFATPEPTASRPSSSSVSSSEESTPATPASTSGFSNKLTGLEELERKLTSKLKHVDDVISTLGRQLIDLQTSVEERVRSDGQSGIKKTRLVHSGTRDYFNDNHVSATAMSAHDHADYEYVLGLGEFTAVMNGVEFRTRHNDYLLVQPSDSNVYGETRRIRYPDVPPEVTSKPTVKEQALEMREWFRAFKEQDHSVRDYRKYFKPNLCYLEAGWTLSSRDTLQEPFASDRHHLEATSWFDLSEKIRYTSYTGQMNALENFAFLPTSMYNVTEDGTPEIAQWNYRVLCHPLARDLPTSMLKLQDDLPYRMAHNKPMSKMADLRGARFKVSEHDDARFTGFTLLDELMSEIPGKNNYGANLTDDAFGLPNFDGTLSWADKLNVGYYHRTYKLGQRGAMGNQIHYRGFNDPNLWVAMTTQKEIMPFTIKLCDEAFGCRYDTRRATYAVPLEILYTTPINGWNPYNLGYDKPEHVEKKGRDGRFSYQRAFNGTSYRHYNRLPAEFFHDNVDMTSPTPDLYGILDPRGEVKATCSSGLTLLTPDIPGVGNVRTRWPIFPVHSDGSTVGEEYQALKDLVLNMQQYSTVMRGRPGEGNTPTGGDEPDKGDYL